MMCLAGLSHRIDMTLRILRATRRHVPELHRMIGQLCAFHGDTSQMGLAQVQSRLIGSGQLLSFVAEQKGAAIAYAVAEVHWRPMDTGDGWDICQLYVTETNRNQGVGRALIDHIRGIARSQGVSLLGIGTAPNNPGAAAAYRAMGLSERSGPMGPRFAIAL